MSDFYHLDGRAYDHPAFAVDYWIPQVQVTRIPRAEVEGVSIDATFTQTIYRPSGVAQTLAYLAHFRALDRDDD